MNINKNILSQCFPRTFGPNLKFGDIVKVRFDNKKPPNGLILSLNTPLVHPVSNNWLDKWKVPAKWFKFSLHKKLQSAHGMYVSFEYSTEWCLVYFPRLLKSGASCVLDLEPDQIQNHTGIVEAHKSHKYILELVRIYAGIDNFEIIETLSRHKGKK
jgi:hypothetical protein